MQKIRTMTFPSAIDASTSAESSKSLEIRITQPTFDISLMEISKNNGLIGRIIAPEIFGSDCRNIHRLKAKLHIQRV